VIKRNPVSGWRTLGVLAVALLIGSSGVLSDPQAVTARARPSSGPGGALAWLELERSLAGYLPIQPLLEAVSGPSAIDPGSDGRLTFLLLGSDSRGGAVSRTDTIMIVSLKNGVISAASIPRDTARIANPDGGTFSGRINAILKKLKVGRTVDQAMAKFEIVIEKLLQIQIDYWAMIKFNGFNALVDEVDPITIDSNKEIKDKKFWDDPTKPSGVYFPAANNYQLWAWQPSSNPALCNGLWKSQTAPYAQQYWCRRALPFVRSRKGSGNSDFVRAKRQQDFVIAAGERVINRGSGSALTSLLQAANGQISAGQLYTNIPHSASDAVSLYNDLAGATVGFQVVFKPTTYSTHIPGTTAYELKLSAVRQVTAQWFK